LARQILAIDDLADRPHDCDLLLDQRFAADKDVRYEAVLEVMDTLQQNQVKKVGLLAKPRGN